MVGWWVVSLVQVFLGGFWLVSDCFCWLRVISDGFKWFQMVSGVLIVTPISQHIEELTLYCTHGRA